MSNLIAYGQNVITTPREEAKITTAGLFIVTKEHEKYMFADVVSVGSEVKNGIQPGDVVVFDYWAGAEYDGYVIVPAEVILAVVDA